MIQANKVLEKNIVDFYEKIPNTNRLVKKTDYSTKTTEIESRIHSATGLVVTTRLNTKAREIENKIIDITNLAAKATFNTNATKMEKKPDSTSFITILEFDKLIKKVLAPK